MTRARACGARKYEREGEREVGSSRGVESRWEEWQKAVGGEKARRARNGEETDFLRGGGEPTEEAAMQGDSTDARGRVGRVRQGPG